MKCGSKARSLLVVAMLAGPVNTALGMAAIKNFAENVWRKINPPKIQKEKIKETKQVFQYKQYKQYKVIDENTVLTYNPENHAIEKHTKNSDGAWTKKENVNLTKGSWFDRFTMDPADKDTLTEGRKFKKEVVIAQLKSDNDHQSLSLKDVTLSEKGDELTYQKNGETVLVNHKKLTEIKQLAEKKNQQAVGKQKVFMAERFAVTKATTAKPSQSNVTTENGAKKTPQTKSILKKRVLPSEQKKEAIVARIKAQETLDEKQLTDQANQEAQKLRNEEKQNALNIEEKYKLKDSNTQSIVDRIKEEESKKSQSNQQIIEELETYLTYRQIQNIDNKRKANQATEEAEAKKAKEAEKKRAEEIGENAKKMSIDDLLKIFNNSQRSNRKETNQQEIEIYENVVLQKMLELRKGGQTHPAEIKLTLVHPLTEKFKALSQEWKKLPETDPRRKLADSINLSKTWNTITNGKKQEILTELNGGTGITDKQIEALKAYKESLTQQEYNASETSSTSRSRFTWMMLDSAYPKLVNPKHKKEESTDDE